MKHFFVLFALLNLSFYSQVSAQNVAGSVEVGVYSAYQPGDYTGSLPIGDVNSSKSFSSFEGGGYETSTYGGMIEYHLGRVFSLVGIVRYENSSEYLIAPGEKNIYRASDSSIHEFDTDFTCDVGVQAITTSILTKTKILGTSLSFLIGANVSIVASTSQEIRLYLYPEPGFPIIIDSLPSIMPDNIHGQTYRYLDNSRTTATLYKGEIDNDPNTLLFGITLGFQYDIPLFAISESENRYITLTPTIVAHRGMSKVSTTRYAFRLNSTNFGLALKVGL